MTFRLWTKILPFWILEWWAKDFSSGWITIEGKEYALFPLFRGRHLLISKEVYLPEKKKEEDKEQKKREKKIQKARQKLQDIKWNYPELKDNFKEEEENYDE